MRFKRLNLLAALLFPTVFEVSINDFLVKTAQLSVPICRTSKKCLNSLLSTCVPFKQNCRPCESKNTKHVRNLKDKFFYIWISDFFSLKFILKKFLKKNGDRVTGVAQAVAYNNPANWALSTLTGITYLSYT